MREKRRQNGCPGHIMQPVGERSPDSSWPGGMRASPGGYHFKRFPSEENREESQQKGANKVECKKWSAKGTYRKASADREPTQDLNTLGGQRPRADLIQVPTAKFRTWSQRGVSTDGGSYDAGACGKCSNIYFFTKMVSNISKR